jgi:hypothetical protein
MMPREVNSMKCWIVIELAKDREPKIIGVYRSRAAAEAVACADPNVWRNVIEKPVI